MKASNIHQFEKLKSAITGEIYTDITTRSLYATDASIYQVLPDAVAIARSEQDLITIVKFCTQYNIPILARGSATSLAGQTVNKGMIIDLTTHFDQIISFDAENKLLTVQPGVTRDQINKYLKSSKLHFAPDPATSARATIGGMIANNSSGTRSIKYGKTIDHIHSLKILLPSGEIIQLGEIDINNYDFEGTDTIKKILRELRRLIFENTQEIKDKYPKTLRRVSGYALDEFLDKDHWNAAKIIAGSEGTLGIILEATIKLEYLPENRVCAVVHFDDRMQSITSVKSIVDHDPASVEMLDYHVLIPAKTNPITVNYYKNTIIGEPQSVMIAEFFGNERLSAIEQATTLKKELLKTPSVYEVRIYENNEDIDQLNALRKEGLGLIMGEPGGRKPMPFIEDAAIPLENLADYISEVLAICSHYKVETILYAHASVGVLHVRPSLNLRDGEDIEILKKISEESFLLVKKYKGSFSSEHGDGRVRSYQIRNFYGDRIYECFKRIKYAFDPLGIMNPGIIIDAPPMDENLRYGKNYKDLSHSFVYNYRNDHSFEEIVHNCSGIGACRNLDGGVMCPSFRATRKEADSTRGRANALRLAMSGQMNLGDVDSDEVVSVLDLCLSCKACKSECPSKVDMSKLKSEVLQIRYNRQGTSLRDRLVLYNEKVSGLMVGKWSFLYNNAIKNPISRWLMHQILGIHKKRKLPSVATRKFNKELKSPNIKDRENRGKVALFADCFVKYNESQLGEAALKILESLGFEVIVLDKVCCQRPLISNGFLKKAQESTEHLWNHLEEVVRQNIPILTIESSCNSALYDDIPDLMKNGQNAEKLQKLIIPMDQYLLEICNKEAIKFKAKLDKPIFYHRHCHQRSLYRYSAGIELLQVAGLTIKESGAGCCGMAGLFGYEKEHYDISVKIANDKLVPAIQENPHHIIVAEGFSCRHQIVDVAGKKALHWLELLDVE